MPGRDLGLAPSYLVYPLSPVRFERCDICSISYSIHEQYHHLTELHRLSLFYMKRKSEMVKCAACHEYYHPSEHDEHIDSWSHECGLRKLEIINCNICGVRYHPIFDDGHQWTTKHLRAVRKLDMKPCELCGVLYNPKTDWYHDKTAKHAYMIMGEQCEYCSERYDPKLKDKHYAKRHYEIYQSQPVHCETCNKTMQRGNLAKHVKTKRHLSKLDS